MPKYFVAAFNDTGMGTLDYYGWSLVEAETEEKAIDLVIDPIFAWAEEKGVDDDDEIVTQQISCEVTDETDVEALAVETIEGFTEAGCWVTPVECPVMQHTGRKNI